MNNQFPSTNNQIMTNFSMTKILKGTEPCDLVIGKLGNWDLFGAWNLVIGI